MADPTVDWVPVAGLLEAASNELEVGQMLHTSVFSLFEAMSAVEIGNPKMDAGKQGQQGMFIVQQQYQWQHQQHCTAAVPAGSVPMKDLAYTLSAA